MKHYLADLTKNPLLYLGLKDDLVLLTLQMSSFGAALKLKPADIVNISSDRILTRQAQVSSFLE